MNETLLYTAWLLSGMNFYGVLRKKGRLFVALTAFGALIFLIPLSFNQTYLNISLLPPILNSSFWLTFHVITVVTGYAFFILLSLIGHLYLIAPRMMTRKQIPLTPYLYWGTFFLITGTLLGGVWADQSWGRFWDWDPKEAWAFVTCCYYLIVIHLDRVRKMGQRGLIAFGTYGLLLVSFTWYGVNYLIKTGMHSYGKGVGGEVYYVAAILLDLVIITFLLRISKNRMQTGD